MLVLVYFLSFYFSLLDLSFLLFILFSSYEPELHPAVCYRIKSLRATLQIFSTGSITVTGILMSKKKNLTCWEYLTIEPGGLGKQDL